MSLNRALYYDNTGSGGWQDISSYVLNISKFDYNIGEIDKGMAATLKVTLDSDCPYYGTANQWKLEIGSNYILLGVPADGIEDIGGYKLEVTLIDYFFAIMHSKTSLSIDGEASASSLAGAPLAVTTINDMKVKYNSNQENLGAANFSTQDGINFYDGMGNTITVTGGQENVRYRTVGIITGKDQSADLGKCYVNLRDILNDIATEEGFSLDVDFGSEEASDTYPISTAAVSTKKIWDAKMINSNVIMLMSGYQTARLISYDLDGNYNDGLTWTTRDWDESSSGEDWIPYQIFPDYRNNCCYIPGWYCASFNPASSMNNYTFRVAKVSVASDGTLTQTYMDDYSGVDLWTKVFDATSLARSDYQTRSYRFTYWLTHFEQTTWYSDEDLADAGKYRIVLAHILAPSDYDLHIIDPDRHYASAGDWKYTYTLATTHGWIVPDWMNGSVVHIYLDGSDYKKDFYRVSQATLTAGYAVSGNGGLVHDDDDPSANTTPPIGVWRESIVYTNTIPDANGEFYYMLPQIPNGFLVREGAYNNYTQSKQDYFSLSGNYDYEYAGTSWDDSIDRAFWWRSLTDYEPATLYWRSKDNYIYKRLYLYQIGIYKDRTEQFLDALVSHGFFYEQRDGNVRLFRINSGGANIGTFTDSDLLNKIELDGYAYYADQYVLQVLNKEKFKESGNISKDIKTIISEYGWFSMWQLDFYSDWTYQINSGQAGLELIADIESFYDVASTRLPLLGDEFTYSGTDYIIIKVEVDAENWIIKISGIADAS